MYKHDLPDDNLYDGIDDSYNDFEIDVKVGDTVISKTPYVFYGKTEIDVGEKWLVDDIYDSFVHIVNNATGKTYLFSANLFNGIFK